MRHFKSKMKVIMYYPRTADTPFQEQLRVMKEIAFATPLVQVPIETWLVLGLWDFRVWRRKGTEWKDDFEARIHDLVTEKEIRSQRLTANFDT